MKFEITPVNHDLQEAIWTKINQKTKPLGSLGKLETIAYQLAATQGCIGPIDLNQPKIFLFAGDHGLAEAGVSPYPQSVTKEMVRNFINQGAAINVFAKQNGIDLQIVDTGIKEPVELPGVVNRRVGAGTKNSLTAPAMSQSDLQQCLSHGSSLIKEAFQSGCRVVGFGEMGIGNSSAAALIAAACMDENIETVTGRGTGCNDEQLAHKIKILTQVLDQHRATDPLAIMACYGGFEMATALGAMLQACELRMNVLVDGFIMGAVALCAAQIDKNTLDYFIFCHQSASPGHQFILEYLGVEPVLDLSMRLGEGSGVAVAWPIIKSAACFYNEMASFTEAEVSEAND